MTSWRTSATVTAGLGLAAVTSAFALAAGPAQAAPAAGAESRVAASCSGTLIDRKVAKHAGKPVAELVVYYKNGINCARLNHLGETRGKALRTSVFLVACKETKPSSVCHFHGKPQAEDATFKYYAGPVRVSARNRCIHAAGDIYYHGKKHLESKPVASHCG